MAFQIFVLSYQSYSSLVPYCSLTQELLEEFGFSRFDEIYIVDILRIIIPDVLLLIVVSISYYLGRKVQIISLEIKRDQIYNNNKISSNDITFTDHFYPLKNVDQLQSENISPGTSSSFSNNNDFDDINNFEKTNTMTRKVGPSFLERFFGSLFPILSTLTFLTFLFVSSCIWPSILSIPYLIIFLILLTKWSFSSSFTNYQLPIKIFLLIYISLHLLMCYIYQIKLFQSILPPEDIKSRLFGLYNIIYTECQQPGHYYINKNIKWQQIALPFVLMAFYWFIALDFSYFRNGIKSSFIIDSYSRNELIEKNYSGRSEKNVIFFFSL